MKMLVFRSIPVGRRRGFIEWVQGSVPLSEICQPFAGSIFARKDKGKKKEIVIEPIKESNQEHDDDSDDDTLSSVAKAGLAKYESLRRVTVDIQRSLPEPKRESKGNGPNPPNNPIQEFLRSFAYDPDGPYKIKRNVMENFVKSCAGYSVCSFLLGVGDRHLDNLLLHQSGHFFHCDYSFILGNDPKKYLPMRITEDMVNGMGGWKSDNFCQFLSLACAVFLTLRRPENVRHLLSLLRIMEGCGLPDLEQTQSLESAIQGLRDRLRLDLNDEQAISFMEKLIEDSCSSKMWIAVDAIHSLAQRF
jgi:phosphatidylinositol 3-kinase